MRYLQVLILFKRSPSESERICGKVTEERKWGKGVIDLHSVIAANESWVFDDYDESSPGCPEKNCTEVCFKDGVDMTINMRYEDFLTCLQTSHVS